MGFMLGKLNKNGFVRYIYYSVGQLVVYSLPLHFSLIIFVHYIADLQTIKVKSLTKYMLKEYSINNKNILKGYEPRRIVLFENLSETTALITSVIRTKGRIK